MTEEMKKNIKTNAIVAVENRLFAHLNYLKGALESDALNTKELRDIYLEISDIRFSSEVSVVDSLDYRLMDAKCFIDNAINFNKRYKESNLQDHRSIVMGELLSAIEMLEKCIKMYQEYYA